MKKSYLKEFQGDIGWVILIFSFKFDAFGRYGSKTNDFPWKLDIFGMKTPVGSLFHGKTSDFLKIHEILKKHTERYSIQVKELVFSSNFLNITWNCENRQFSVKIYQTGASYLLKKVILLKSIIFQWNTLNGMAFALKSWYFYSNRQFFMINHQSVEGSPLKIG